MAQKIMDDVNVMCCKKEKGKNGAIIVYERVIQRGITTAGPMMSIEIKIRIDPGIFPNLKKKAL